MPEKLSSLLAKDEKLLWSGRPESFETLDRTNKTKIMTWLIIKAVITAGLVIAYIIACIGTEGINIPVLITLLVLGAFAMAYPFLTANHLRNKKIYGLTDRRILRIGDNTESVPYGRIQHAALRKDADGHTSLLCGNKTCKLDPTRWRSVADISFSNRPEDPEAEDVVLYALPMNADLEAILKKYLPIM